MPAVKPATMPVAAPIVATTVVTLVHVPPLTLLASVLAAPVHNETVPVIVEGVAYTVTTAELVHPPPVV